MLTKNKILVGLIGLLSVLGFIFGVYAGIYSGILREYVSVPMFFSFLFDEQSRQIRSS
jgi:formate-dependent nitrite reductase membrane component NrfD